MIFAAAAAIAVLSYFTNRFLLGRLKHLGTKSYAAQVRWSTQAKPTIGGLSFLVGLLSSLLVVVLFGWKGSNLISSSVVCLFMGALAAFAMGLTDDIRQTGPGSKFIVQVGCGIVLWFGGIEIHVAHQWINLLLTVFWTIAIMNSINMLDNMDGVSGGTALSTLIGLYCIADEGLFGWLALGMAATLVGFLALNRYPSKLFMGDAGSQLLGFLLAALSLAVFNGDHFGAAELGGDNWRWLLLVPLFFTTLCDTALVTVNRMLHGRSPFKGGRDHSTHNLAFLGLSDARIANLFTLWSAANAFVVYRLLFTESSEARVPMIVLFIILVGIYATFVVISRVNIKNQRLKYAS